MIPTETLSRFILSREKQIPNASGELSDLLTAIGLGVKVIARLVQTAGIRGLTGYTGNTNVQGEKTYKLDEEADSVLVDILGACGDFGSLVSEERDGAIETPFCSQDAKYVVAFDPLDGSSNIGTNIPVGTIFCVFKRVDRSRECGEKDFFQSGKEIVAAGYSVYGAKTSFVYSAGEGVHDFTLDPAIGEFVLEESDLRFPQQGSTYSVNEGYWEIFDPTIQNFIGAVRSSSSPSGKPYGARYVGSLVADFDRTLRKGGIFLHPATTEKPNGKLRLLYECLPLAFLATQAGGIALDGHKPLINKKVTSIHERTPFVVGGQKEIEHFLSFVK